MDPLEFEKVETVLRRQIAREVGVDPESVSMNIRQRRRVLLYLGEGIVVVIVIHTQTSFRLPDNFVFIGIYDGVLLSLDGNVIMTVAAGRDQYRAGLNTTDEPPEDESSASNTVMIVAGSVGGVVLVLGICLYYWCIPAGVRASTTVDESSALPENAHHLFDASHGYEVSHQFYDVPHLYEGLHMSYCTCVKTHTGPNSPVAALYRMDTELYTGATTVL